LTRRHLTTLLVSVAAVAIVGAAGARALGLRPVRIVSDSMAPAVDRGDWIITKDLGPDARAEVQRGDIVMFRFPLGTSGRAVKRVVAVAGDEVAITEHQVTVNGRQTPIAGAPSAEAARTRVETVPVSHVFLLGDNAQSSIDSRSFGAVPTAEIVARDVARMGSVALVALAVFVAGLITAGAASIYRSRR
jgi:signal peptidase I